MVEAIKDLRRICQDPVSKWQDLAGGVFGSRFSIYFTKLFLTLGFSPSTVSLLMAFFGVSGAMLLLFQGSFAVAGCLFLILHYLLDCSDGEMARYHEKQDIQWTLYDYLIHYLVKTLFFLCLAIGAYRRGAGGWIFFFSFSAVFFIIMEKTLRELYYIIYCKKVRGYVGSVSKKSLSRLWDKVRDFKKEGKEAPSPAQSSPRKYLSLIRQAVVVFEIYIFFFLGAAFLDLLLPIERLFFWNLNGKEILLLLYGIILPLHFFDYLYSYLKNNRLQGDISRLISKIEGKQK